MYGKYSDMYAKWCECYDPNNIEIQTIEKYCTLRGKRIIDIGCGTGRFLFRVLPMAEHVIGIDNDREAIGVLKNTLNERHANYLHKISLYDEGVESLELHKELVDLAVFSWSFYALNEYQMKKSLSNIHSLLNDNGMLIILQPVGGQFENVMRTFFDEHEDMDEYSAALTLMNKFIPELYVQTAIDKIHSEFVVTDLNIMCKALKMFAVTEGGCNEEDTPMITVEQVRELLEPYKNDEKYHLDDLVDVFIFKKKV